MRCVTGATIMLLVFSGAANIKAEDAWVSLFNGKHLSGWKLYEGEKWCVTDGAIVAESTTKGCAYLATIKSYSL